MVLIRVDLPKPVWPEIGQYLKSTGTSLAQRTDTNDIELKPSFEEFLFDLLGDAVKTNVASWEDGIPLGHCHGHNVMIL